MTTIMTLNLPALNTYNLPLKTFADDVKRSAPSVVASPLNDLPTDVFEKAPATPPALPSSPMAQSPKQRSGCTIFAPLSEHFPSVFEHGGLYQGLQIIGEDKIADELSLLFNLKRLKSLFLPRAKNRSPQHSFSVLARSLTPQSSETVSADKVDRADNLPILRYLFNGGSQPLTLESPLFSLLSKDLAIQPDDWKMYILGKAIRKRESAFLENPLTWHFLEVLSKELDIAHYYYLNSSCLKKEKISQINEYNPKIRVLEYPIKNFVTNELYLVDEIGVNPEDRIQKKLDLNRTVKVNILSSDTLEELAYKISLLAKPEASSSLDAPTDSRVQSAFQEMSKIMENLVTTNYYHDNDYLVVSVDPPPSAKYKYTALPIPGEFSAEKIIAAQLEGTFGITPSVSTPLSMNALLQSMEMPPKIQ